MIAAFWQNNLSCFSKGRMVYAGHHGACATGRQAIEDTVKSTLPDVYMQQQERVVNALNVTGFDDGQRTETANPAN